VQGFDAVDRGYDGFSPAPPGFQSQHQGHRAGLFVENYALAAMPDQTKF
jgi:hypothetical protein